MPALYSGDPDQLSYCYSINILPSALNSTCSTDRFITAFKAATQKGTNVMYMVVKDEAGNVNWTNYASAIFIADTISPGLPLNLKVSDTSDQSAKRWSLTATWDPPSFEGNGISSYIVERSPDGHGFTEIGNTSTTAFVDLDVEPNKTYYYRVRASDNVDNRGGPSGSISGKPKGSFGTPPTIVISPTVSSDSNQATVHWATNRASTSFVYYGTSPTNLSQSKGSLASVTNHNQAITGLQPSTTYYYRVQSFDNNRSYELDTAYSQIYTFKTTDSARLFNVKASSTSLNSTILSWQTSVPTKTRIEYGPDIAYTNIASNEEAGFSTNHIYKLDKLTSGTLYHYRIVSETQFGSTLYSDDYTVQTIAQPAIRNVQFQPLDEEANTAVKVTWSTNVPTTSTVRYQGTGVSKEVSQSKLTTSHSATIRDLASSTEYSFGISGRDEYGNLASSDDQKWQSGYDTRTPSISDLNVSMTTTKGSNNTRAQLIVSWKTDEPSTSQVSFKTRDGSPTETPLDTEPTTQHVVVISDLNLAEIYTIKVMSRDLSGNIAYGAQTSVVTPDKETNVLDSVLTVLERIFRF